MANAQYLADAITALKAKMVALYDNGSNAGYSAAYQVREDGY